MTNERVPYMDDPKFTQLLTDIQNRIREILSDVINELKCSGYEIYSAAFIIATWRMRGKDDLNPSDKEWVENAVGQLVEDYKQYLTPAVTTVSTVENAEVDDTIRKFKKNVPELVSKFFSVDYNSRYPSV